MSSQIVSRATLGADESCKIENFLRNAYSLASDLSDDPSTQNGAILVNRYDNEFGGWNAFPRGVEKTPERLERPKKYSFMEHAERNAIYNAAFHGEITAGATLYCTWYACADCARAIVQSGVNRVIGHKQMFDRTPDHWKASIADGDAILDEAGVARLQFDGEIGGVTVLMNGESWNP